MCIICVDLTKDKLTSVEARKNLNEMRTAISKEHAVTVLQLIWKKEDDEYAQQFEKDDLSEEHIDGK
tara:strand:- start:301 stop:501 length:201 start_codon:yes stop_codon:yes gene_type:complete